MEAGLQIFNDDSFIQLDSNYKNLEFKSKGTFSIAASDGSSGGSNISFTNVSFVGVQPIIALNCANPCYASFVSRSGNTWTFQIYNGSNFAITGEYFFFDEPAATSSGKLGLQIFKEDGTLGYDSNKSYMRVLEYLSTTGSSADVTKSYPGKKVAFSMSDFGYRMVVTASPTDPGDPNLRFVQSWIHLGKSPAGQFNVKDTATFTNARYGGGSTMQGFSEYPSRWLIIDVTDL